MSCIVRTVSLYVMAQWLSWLLKGRPIWVWFPAVLHLITILLCLLWGPLHFICCYIFGFACFLSSFSDVRESYERSRFLEALWRKWNCYYYYYYYVTPFQNYSLSAWPLTAFHILTQRFVYFSMVTESSRKLTSVKYCVFSVFHINQLCSSLWRPTLEPTQNAWSCTSTTPHGFRLLCLIMYSVDFTVVSWV
jgi:hypothetical protein